MGVPEPGGAAAAVAVKVTCWPTFDGFGVEVSDKVDPLGWTTCTSEELPGLKFESPL